MSTHITKPFPIFLLNQATTADEFVKYRSSLFDYPSYEVYKSTVTKSELSNKDIRILFDWKSSTDLALKKEKSYLSHDCPMFDKYVYRAFRFIQKLKKERLPSDQSERLKIFHEQYRSFFLEMCKLANGSDVFDIDKELWTFGKIIKEYPGLTKAGN